MNSNVYLEKKEYLEFLRATQSSLASDNQNVHAGYFGEDRGSGDESIQAEVDDILKNKEKLLSFKDENGNWQTRRFYFQNGRYVKDGITQMFLLLLNCVLLVVTTVKFKKLAEGYDYQWMKRVIEFNKMSGRLD